MKIWELSLLDHSYADWPFSDPNQRVFVRAETEDQARSLAYEQFSNSRPRVSSNQRTRTNPWHGNNVVECIESENSNYPTDGPAKVLEPENFE